MAAATRKRPRFRWPTPGTCRVCGCTDERACPEGCSWVDTDQLVCSTCGGTDGDLAGVLAWIPHVVKKYGSGKNVTRWLQRLAREALARYSRRLVAEDHA